ncbi:MAG: sigma-54-dependent Fis family transcriptional regulator [Oligoflexia bacterium]|nr:sigma-54-dependent Fis family transcriptional regulator [Oligoflexia bacterium]MBF0364719.1 sigma-54-dependent Fis family transcriptional regulator [Oligoflexia bacterium]
MGNVISSDNKNHRPRVLILEDDELFRLSIIQALNGKAMFDEADTNEKASVLLEKNRYDVAFFDLKLGTEYLDFNLVRRAAREKKIYTVVLSSYDDEKFIDKAYDCGCNDYFIKSADLSGISRTIEKFSLQRNEYLFENFIKNRYITKDKETIAQLHSLLIENNSSKRPIFIEGASGVGKSLLAEAAHEFLIGQKGQFVHINCKGISETLLGSELFGHEKGAFTDAKESKMGKLKLADNGTLFLDEIATMPMALQAALLVAIEKKQFMPVGGNKLVSSNFRLICATNENMVKLVKEGKFREDLFYRIYKNVISLRALKERKDDISLLIDHFRKKLGSRRVVIRPAAMEILKNYQYPANVRDVEDIVELLLKCPKGRIDIEDLPDFVLKNENRYFKDNVENPVLNDYVLNYVRNVGLLQYLEDHKNIIINKFIDINRGRTRDAMREMNYFSNRIYDKVVQQNHSSKQTGKEANL